jgi:hypothetical protein
MRFIHSWDKRYSCVECFQGTDCVSPLKGSVLPRRHYSLFVRGGLRRRVATH